VLVEGHAQAEDEHGRPLDETISLGRTYRDAPEIDGYVLVEGALPVGEIVPVRITGAMTYDLVGAPAVGPGQVIAPGRIYGPGELA